MNEHKDRAIHLWAVVSQEHFIGTMVRAQNNHGNKQQVTSKAVTLNAHRGSPEGPVLSSQEHRHSSVLTTAPARPGASDTTSR